MKVAACILLFIVGALTMQPVFSNQRAMAEAQCCGEEDCPKPEKQKHEKKDCEGNGCNPFMACSLGNYYLAETSFVLTLPQPLIKEKFPVVNDNCLSGNADDFWHPPEETLLLFNTGQSQFYNLSI